jgi:hypothetical protein
MDCLPPEILLMICENIEIEDIQALRQVNRGFAAIAGQYLLPEVHFFVHDQSLDKLQAICNHPIISKRVKSLLYEALLLDPHEKSFSEWELDVQNSDLIHARVDHIVQRYHPEEERQRDRHTRGQLRKCYENYVALHRRQQEILETRYDFECITEAVKRFPALEKITMSSGFWFSERSNAIMQAFEKPSLQKPYVNGVGPEGVRQLTSLLLAVAQSEIKLKKLRAGSLSWKVFQQDESTMKPMTQACKHLTSIKLFLGTEMDDTKVGLEAAECREFLKNGALRNLLTSMPNLRTLDVSFDYASDADDTFPAALQDMIPDHHHWPHLEKLSIGCFDAEEWRLLSLYEKHKATLKRIGLCDVMLRGGGSWLSFLPKIRRILPRLESACVCGNLRAMGLREEESWVIGTPDAFPRDAERKKLGKFVVKGGVCPLSRGNMVWR